MASTPANPSSAQPNPAPPDASNAPSGTQNNAPENASSNPPSNSIPTISVSGPDDVIISERFLADSAWPKDLILDLGKSNWSDWSFRLENLTDNQGFSEWLDGSLPRPDIMSHPKAHRIWQLNDRSLRAFMLARISKIELPFVQHLKDSRSVYQELRKRHEHLGLYAQVVLIKKALEIRFSNAASFSTTISELNTLHTQIMNMGPIDPDNLYCVFLINALGDQYSSLQSSIQSMADNPNFSLSTIVKRLQSEETLLRRREELGLQPEALAAIGKPRKSGNLLCAHCKCTNHLTDFCIHPGGKMAGKTLEDAQKAQRAALGKSARSQPAAGTAPSTAHVATVTNPPKAAPSPTPSSSPIIWNGVSYYPGPPSTPSHSSHTPSSVESEAIYAYDDSSSISDYGYHAYAAIEELKEESKTSVDWSSHSHPVDLLQPANLLPAASAYVAGRFTPVNIDKCPFIFDTGANVHISPERSDFRSWTAIPPRPVKGLGGSRVFATGIGSIDVSIASGHKLLLQNVLHIPASTVRLISVLSLNRDGGYVSHFGNESCWITNKHGTTIARGTVSSTRNLFTLDTSSPRITHSKHSNHPPPPPTSLYASRAPNVETWHRRLGHCNTRTIIDMARSGVVEGMTIDVTGTGRDTRLQV
jgi:gag-polypeptide of LTR copia-type